MSAEVKDNFTFHHFVGEWGAVCKRCKDNVSAQWVEIAKWYDGRDGACFGGFLEEQAGRYPEYNIIYLAADLHLWWHIKEGLTITIAN